MTDFTLDTSGAVEMGEAYGGQHTWPDLSPFEQGYVAAVCRAAEDTLGGFTITGVRFSDLAPETLAAIRTDCAALHAISAPSPLPNTEHGGGVFWRERSARWTHSFFQWSGKKLRAAFPPLTVTLGDDGKVYARQS